MQVTSELLEKYHRQQCTPEERLAVELWLEHDSFDDLDDTGSSVFTNGNTNAFNETTGQQSPAASEATRLEIWSALSKAISANTTGAAPTVPFWRSGMFRMALAASVLTLFMIGALTFSRDGATVLPDAVFTPMELSSASFTIGKSPGTRADVRSRSVDFCGLMRIEVRQDAEVTLRSTCVETDETETFMLRKGETYLAFNHQFAKENELLVVNLTALDDLPPVLRRQFNFR